MNMLISMFIRLTEIVGVLIPTTLSVNKTIHIHVYVDWHEHVYVVNINVCIYINININITTNILTPIQEFMEKKVLF